MMGRLVRIGDGLYFGGAIIGILLALASTILIGIPVMGLSLLSWHSHSSFVLPLVWLFGLGDYRMVHTEVTRKKTSNGPRGSHVSRALKEMENAKGFLASRVSRHAKEHTKCLEMRLCGEIISPSAQELMEEFGGLINDYGSSRTRETQHTRTLGLFWSMKSLFSLTLEERQKVKEWEDMDDSPVISRLEGLEDGICRIASSQVITDEYVNAKIDAMDREIMGRSFSWPPPACPSATQLVFRRCLKAIKRVSKQESPGVGSSYITIYDYD